MAGRQFIKIFSDHPLTSAVTLLLVGIALGALMFFRVSSAMLSTEIAEPRPQHRSEDNSVAAVINAEAAAAVVAVPTLTVHCEERKSLVGRGDTMTSLLSEFFTPVDIFALAKACEPVFQASNLRVGQPYSLSFEDGQCKGFIYEIDSEKQLQVCCRGGEFIAEIKDISYQSQLVAIQGSIESSLFASIAELGEDPVLACRLSDIFAWDIDFVRDLRQGDSFRLLCEKRYRDGAFAGYGRIWAAEFINQDKIHRAAYFDDGEAAAYYDLEGRSLKKAFLKSPLSYTRISSGYSDRRLHPVLKVWRPHRAIDYAAPTGTPVKAVAAGVVTQRSYDKSNGNKIRLRHANHYETTYIHLSRFGSGIKVGKRVEQGQLIGYVGATGIATGPHLDFRVFKNGTPINPLHIERAPSAPLANDHLADFREKWQAYFSLLEGSNLVQEAKSDEL
ncbi:MAG TPA: peptidase M23 [Proteobacteria bacterium]|nr:peptidase M23 [Pseudomonadota bacterium]